MLRRDFSTFGGAKGANQAIAGARTVLRPDDLPSLTGVSRLMLQLETA